MNDNEKIKLQLFNERALAISESKFIKWLNNSGNKRRIETISFSNPEWCNRYNMNMQDLKSFALDLRLLIQGMDGFSIDQIERIYKRNSGREDNYYRFVKEQNQQLTSYLEKKSILELEGNNLTKWQLFEIIFYGGIAHNNEKHFKNYVRLTKNNNISIFIIADFWNVIILLQRCIMNISKINKLMLEEYKIKN